MGGGMDIKSVELNVSLSYKGQEVVECHEQAWYIEVFCEFGDNPFNFLFF